MTSWNFCTSGAAIAKAGANANSSVIASGALLQKWSEQAEGTICMKCKADFLTNYASIQTPIQQALQDAASDAIAIKIINYDMSGYSGLNEASTMCDILKDDYDTIIKDLREDKYQKINK